MADDFKVPYTSIVDIKPHPDPETTRLEIAIVYGFQVIVQKGRYQKGDSIVYVPIDSVLSEKVESLLFNKDSKIKLNNHRIRQVRIRKFPSQGMVVDPKDVSSLVDINKISLESDLSSILEISKYEPPAPKFQQSSGPKLRNKPLSNPHFRCYNGINNIKWLPYAFEENEEVIVQCKLHGSHVRFGKAPFSANTLWKKILKLLRLAPKFENVYGSNNVELTNRSSYKGYYDGDIYGEALKKIDAFSKIKEGEFWHGELIGPGVQKGYTYGHTEHHVVVFDVRVLQEDGKQKWLNPEEAEKLAKERGFDFVPVLYRGPFSLSLVDRYSTGPSVYCPQEKIREGCVIKSRFTYDREQSKQVVKCINPDYLDGDHGDNH